MIGSLYYLLVPVQWHPCCSLQLCRSGPCRHPYLHFAMNLIASCAVARTGLAKAWHSYCLALLAKHRTLLALLTGAATCGAASYVAASPLACLHAGNSPAGACSTRQPALGTMQLYIGAEPLPEQAAYNKKRNKLPAQGKQCTGQQLACLARRIMFCVALALGAHKIRKGLRVLQQALLHCPKRLHAVGALRAARAVERCGRPSKHILHTSNTAQSRAFSSAVLRMKQPKAATKDLPQGPFFRSSTHGQDSASSTARSSSWARELQAMQGGCVQDLTTSAQAAAKPHNTAPSRLLSRLYSYAARSHTNNLCQAKQELLCEGTAPRGLPQAAILWPLLQNMRAHARQALPTLYLRKTCLCCVHLTQERPYA